MSTTKDRKILSKKLRTRCANKLGSGLRRRLNRIERHLLKANTKRRVEAA